MPLLAALSRLRLASRMASAAASVSPASAASRNLRTLVFSGDLTALLRCLAFSFCLLRLICDLMFATRKPRLGYWYGWSADASRSCAAAPHHQQRAFVPTKQDSSRGGAGPNQRRGHPRWRGHPAPSATMDGATTDSTLADSCGTTA